MQFGVHKANFVHPELYYNDFYSALSDTAKPPPRAMGIVISVSDVTS